jgi:hypothetical protein
MPGRPLVAVALDDAGERAWGLAAGVAEELGDTARVSAGPPMVDGGAAGDVEGPEVAGLDLATTGLEIVDGRFVKLAATTSPVVVLDDAADGRDPVSTEGGPVAKGLAVKVDSLAGEDLGLPVVGKVADEAVVDDLRDEPGRGDATVLQGGRQRGDGTPSDSAR